MRPFTRHEQDLVERAHRAGAALACPACGTELDREDVRSNPSVSYVRRRILLTCPSCHGHMVLDRSEER